MGNKSEPNNDKAYIVTILLFVLFICAIFCLFSACNSQYEQYDAKEFLFLHKDIKIKFNRGPWLDYLTNRKSFITNYETALTLSENGLEYEIFAGNKRKKIGTTNYFVSIGGLGHVFFWVEMPKPVIKKEPKQKKEKVKMSLSLGTWIMLIIVMLIIAKIAHKITLKTIFKPTKKTAKHIKKEWDES